MADYIKREDACRTIRNYIEEKIRTYPKRKFRLLAIALDLCSIFMDIPAADVRENVPAHWIIDCERVAGDGWTYKQRHCSNCGFQTVECVNFCQNCGADMRGEKDDG